MIYDRHSELQSKWDKAFWARGYYVETIGNVTDEAVQKYILEFCLSYICINYPINITIPVLIRATNANSGIPRKKELICLLGS